MKAKHKFTLVGQLHTCTHTHTHWHCSGHSKLQLATPNQFSTWNWQVFTDRPKNESKTWIHTCHDMHTAGIYRARGNFSLRCIDAWLIGLFEQCAQSLHFMQWVGVHFGPGQVKNIRIFRHKAAIQKLKNLWLFYEYLYLPKCLSAETKATIVPGGLYLWVYLETSNKRLNDLAPMGKYKSRRLGAARYAVEKKSTEHLNWTHTPRLATPGRWELSFTEKAGWGLRGHPVEDWKHWRADRTSRRGLKTWDGDIGRGKTEQPFVFMHDVSNSGWCARSAGSFFFAENAINCFSTLEKPSSINCVFGKQKEPIWLLFVVFFTQNSVRWSRCVFFSCSLPHPMAVSTRMFCAFDSFRKHALFRQKIRATLLKNHRLKPKAKNEKCSFPAKRRYQCIFHMFSAGCFCEWKDFLFLFFYFSFWQLPLLGSTMHLLSEHCTSAV